MPPRVDGIGGYEHANDPYFNPFAGSSQTSFTSAVKPKDTRVDTRPGFRRRGSESSAQRRTDHDPWNEGSGEGRREHMRASTMDTVVRNGGRGTKMHPLASTSSAGRMSAGGSSRSSLVDTRPGLKRILSDLDTSISRSARSSEDSLPSRPRDATVTETVVIVHEVTPKDSLAGVALKYGISMADLRKANQLWPSDPIHLRKVLYIPLDKSQKAKDLVLTHLESTSQSGSQTELVDTTSGTDNDNRTLSPPPPTPLNIQRVPVSRLSFFPPSSSSHLAVPNSTSMFRTMPRSPPRASSRDPIPFEIATSSSSAHSDTSASSLPPSSAFAAALQSQVHANGSPSRSHIHSLTSLFNSLPLAKLPFDSGASTPTQASDEQEHELVDVGPRISSEFDSARASDSRSGHSQTRRAGPKDGAASAKSDAVELGVYRSPPMLRSPRSLGTGDPWSTLQTPRKQHVVAAYVTPERNVSVAETVRTSQLEPSPTMQLPLKPRRDRDRLVRDTER